MPSHRYCSTKPSLSVHLPPSQQHEAPEPISDRRARQHSSCNLCVPVLFPFHSTPSRWVTLGSRANAIDVYMGPAHLLTPEDKVVRDLAFKNLDGTVSPLSSSCHFLTSIYLSSRSSPSTLPEQTHIPFYGCFSFPRTSGLRPETCGEKKRIGTCKGR